VDEVQSREAESHETFHLRFVFFGGRSSFAQQPPEIRYRSVPNFLKLPPISISAKLPASRQFERTHLRLLRSNSTGPAYGASAAHSSNSLRRKISPRNRPQPLRWSFAHTVKVDKDDNIWVTDKGSDMVIKFNPEGRVVMVFGRKQEASDEGTEPLKQVKPSLPPVDGMFARSPTSRGTPLAAPTSLTATSIRGVAKIDKTETGSSLGRTRRSARSVQHTDSIAVDARDNIYVADRGNRRIQVFDTDGKFLRVITIDVPVDPTPARHRQQAHRTTGAMAPGAPWAICITPGQNQVLYSSDGFPGRIYKLSLDGKVLGVFGKSGKELGQFGWVHEIACPPKTNFTSPKF